MRALPLAVLSLAVAGCLAPPTLPPRADTGARDGGTDAWLPPFLVLGTLVTDGTGRSWRPDAAPRRPTIRVTFSSPPADASLVLLLTGDADPDLLDDLDATPLRIATTDRAIDVDADLAGNVVTLTPRAPLDGGSVVTLAVPRWTADAGGHKLPEAYTRTFTISTDADAGAQATDAWPPDGAFEVATGLALAAVRFDGTLADPLHTLALTETHGSPVRTTASLTPCASIGWPDGVCVQLVPLSALSPGTDHTLAIAAGARDATGSMLPAFASHFGTAAETPSPLAWTPLDCSLGETASASGCARSDDESIVFRGQLDAAARLTWSVGSDRGGLVAPRGTVLLHVGSLAPSAEATLVLSALDYAGTALDLTLPLTTTEPLPTISITEVRADPAGLEPRQEFVEILNYGAAAVSLAGLALSDSATSTGDALPSTTIPAGAHALIVPIDFDPDDTAGGRDVAPPAGAILVRVDASLGSGGLSNSGEPLFLRDSMNRWISAAPATPPPREAICIVRTSTSRRTGEPGSFGYDAALTCTPGR